MSRILSTVFWGLLLSVGARVLSLPAEISQPSFPPFEGQEIDRSLKVGYAVELVDINGDGARDIVVVDTTRVIWFENPAWKLRTIIQDQTQPDNVCISAYDVDGDGGVELALGAGWRGTNTSDPGTLQLLRRGKTLDALWSVHPIDTEYSVHRVRFADIDGDGSPELISAPLLGPGSTAQSNWAETAVRLRAYKIPKNPFVDSWTSQVLAETLHVMHNFWPDDLDGDYRVEIFTASYEGVHLLKRSSAGAWQKLQLGQGNQENPQGRRGSSEIKLGGLRNGQKYVATIEPWHGHQVVVYTPSQDSNALPWTRQVLDEQLKWGHAVWCVDLNSDGDQEIIVGVRDPLNQEVRYGVNVYQSLDGSGARWQKHVIDNGAVAVEDLAAADLNSDGRVDIVAVGRATGNVKIYWNRGL